MKQNIKWALLMLLTSVCLQSKAQFAALDTVRLNKAYDALTKSAFGEKEQREYFDAFPKTRGEFMLTYGYYPPYNNLSYKALEHVLILSELEAIPQEEFCDRLISLGCNGQNDVDAVSYLQEFICEYTKKNPDAMMKAMEGWDKNEVYQFWRFLFASTTPDNSVAKDYAFLRYYIGMHPKLSAEDLDLAFVSSFGRSTIDSDGGYPHYDKMKEEMAKSSAKTAKPKVKGKKKK